VGKTALTRKKKISCGTAGRPTFFSVPPSDPIGPTQNLHFIRSDLNLYLNFNRSDLNLSLNFIRSDPV